MLQWLLLAGSRQPFCVCVACAMAAILYGKRQHQLAQQAPQKVCNNKSKTISRWHIIITITKCSTTESRSSNSSLRITTKQNKNSCNNNNNKFCVPLKLANVTSQPKPRTKPKAKTQNLS